MENATSSLIVIKELAGNPPPQLNAIQELLAPHVQTIITFWTTVWIFTALYLAWFLLREYRAQRNGNER